MQRPIPRSVTLFGGWSKTPTTLSESIIQAIPGEYYAYSARFTAEKPLYPLLKCKANKVWAITSATDLGVEANLLFLFDTVASAEACAIQEAYASGLLGDSINGELFGKTWVAPAKITAHRFYELHTLENVQALINTCNTACEACGVRAKLEPGMIVAVMTDTSKYGMFLVKRLTSVSIHIDACHILL